MKRLILALVAVLMTVQVRADEGMWLPLLIKRLNHRDMQKEGLKLTAEEIYSVNRASLKDAIVSFGGFCTGEIVSNQGLIFTNHHCGYDAIAQLSSAENNRLQNGWWATRLSEELPAKGLYVRFLVRMDDATRRITSRLHNGMPQAERNGVIEAEIAAIKKENSENGKYVVEVKSFLNGNEYYYFVYRDYKDVRLVGTPPSSLGKFGGDTDNWEWPRHTADFSVFRVYADAKGDPAEYSPNNRPLVPRHFLPISTAGYQPGDYAMIMGYPGRTNRYLTSFGLDKMVGKNYPAWVEASKVAMDVMKSEWSGNETLKIHYLPRYSNVANYWKNRQGTIDAVNKNGTIAQKQRLESVFEQWAKKPANRGTYGNVLSELRAYYDQNQDRYVQDQYLAILGRQARYTTLPVSLGAKLLTYAQQDQAGRTAMKPKLQKEIADAYQRLDPRVETRLLIELLKLYQDRVPVAAQRRLIRTTNLDALSQAVATSIFVRPQTLETFLDVPSKEVLENDVLYRFSNELVSESTKMNEQYAEVDSRFATNSRLFLDGLRKATPGKKYYPDANSTMRLTYGKVATLPVRADRKYHGIKNNYYTDLDGLVAKYKKGDEEFDLQEDFLKLVRSGDYGRFTDKRMKAKVPLNFLSTNDITGGNSGSPVMNAKGELIGIAFDGNSEALSGDIEFEPKLQRTINLDVRFILFMIEKYSRAHYLFNEMKLVD